MIIKCDSVIPDQQAKGLRKLWQYLTIKWPFKNADIIIVESNRLLEAIQPYAKKSFATGNVIVMPNCVHVKDIDMTKFQKAINSKLREKTIISIGRIEPIKGTLDLIRAFDIFRKYHPDWKLKIIGPLTNKEYVIEALKLKTKLGIPDSSLKFTGPKFGDDLYLEMAKAHTFTIASHPLGDGRNNTLPYTLYFGCQPVVTDVGDMKEAVNPIGITCIKPQDPLAMAMAMEKAIIKPVPLATMQDYILDNLNWETHLPKLLKAIRLTVDENNKDEQGQNEIK